MKKKHKKKMNRLRLNKLVVILFVFLVVIVCCLGLTIVKCFGKSNFTIEPRTKMIEKSKKEDSNDYETVGWLRVEGTNMDMPILYSPKNTDSYPVEKDNYAWTMANDSKFHKVMNIMGHNIYNLSSQPDINPELTKSFESLMSFVYYDFAKDNRYIQLTINDKDYVYKIYSVDFIYASDVTRFLTLDYKKKTVVKNQLDMFLNNTLFDYDVDVNEDDTLLSLVTCTRFFGNEGDRFDFLVNARLLRDGEKIKDYNIKKNDNYNKIEEILRGEEDEEDSV